jgi:hypothetical protein
VYKYDLLDSEHFTLHKTKTEKLVDIQEWWVFIYKKIYEGFKSRGNW